MVADVGRGVDATMGLDGEEGAVAGFGAAANGMGLGEEGEGEGSVLARLVIDIAGGRGRFREAGNGGVAEGSAGEGTAGGWGEG
jgi:hypothetical protein